MRYERPSYRLIAAGLPALTANFSTNKPDNVRIGKAGSARARDGDGSGSKHILEPPKSKLTTA